MIKELKYKFKQLLKSKKLNVFGAFFLLAFILLYASKLSQNYTENLTFKLDFKNIPESNVLIQQDSVVEVVVSASGFRLLPLFFEDNVLRVDYNTDITQTSNKYFWISKDIKPKIQSQMGEQVQILSVKPDTLWFKFEALAVKKVPVKLGSEVVFKPGYDVVGNFKIEPDSVKIIGSETDIKMINSIETEPFPKTEVHKDIDVSLQLNLPESYNHLKLSSRKVVISGKIEKFTEGTVNVPVVITNVPSNVQLNFFPKTVTVSYYLPLQEYKTVKPSQFKVECDYSSIVENKQSYLIPKLVKKPTSVKAARLKQKKIEFIEL